MSYFVANESPLYIENVLSDVTGRWSALLDLLQATKTRLALVSDSKKFEDDFTTLQRTLLMYSQWIEAQESTVAEKVEPPRRGDTMQLQRQFEKCKVSSSFHFHDFSQF